MKASPKAEEVGLSFPPQSLLLLCRPLPSPGSSCRTITKASHAIQQTSGLAPNCLQAEKTPNLPSQHCNFSLLTLFVPAPSPLQLLLVLGSGHCQVFHQQMHIL